MTPLIERSNHIVHISAAGVREDRPLIEAIVERLPVPVLGINNADIFTR